MDRPWLWALTGYLIAVNLITFMVFGIDKRRAVRQRWRVSEKTLFLLALLGGGLGAFLGMRVFRHKTKHGTFQFFIPLILALELAAGAYLWFRLCG